MLRPPVMIRLGRAEDGAINHDHYIYGAPKKWMKRKGQWVEAPPLPEDYYQPIRQSAAKYDRKWIMDRMTARLLGRIVLDFAARRAGAAWACPGGRVTRLLSDKVQLVVTALILAETHAYFSGARGGRSRFWMILRITR